MNVLYVKTKEEKQIEILKKCGNNKNKKNTNKDKGRIKKWFNKFYENFRNLFCIVDLEEIFNGYIAKISLSKCDISKTNVYNKPKKLCENIRNYIIARKIRRIVNEKNIDGIVLEDKIMKNENFVNKLILPKTDFSTKENKYLNKKSFVKERNIFFFDGNGLFKYIIYEVLEYIINIQNRKVELEDIYIVANNIDENMLNNIAFLSTKFKNINIVSKNIKKYNYVENFVYNNTGNNVILLNNKRKSLKRAKYIINVDNNIKELNEYLIYRKAIIININSNQNKTIESKENKTNNNKENFVNLFGFDGIIIKSFQIDVNNKVKQIFKQYELNNITNMATLYESFLNKKENFGNIRSKIEDAELIVTKLCGNNGIIDENEYKRVNINDNEVKKYY